MAQDEQEFVDVHILVVSNDPKKYRLVMRQVSNLGMTASAMSSLKKALTYVVAKKPTHLFLSVNIPKMNPLKVAKLLSTTFNLPVILYPEDFGYKTTKFLKDCGWPHVMTSSFSGATVTTTLRLMRKQEADAEEARARAEAGLPPLEAAKVPDSQEAFTEDGDSPYTRKRKNRAEEPEASGEDLYSAHGRKARRVPRDVDDDDGEDLYGKPARRKRGRTQSEGEEEEISELEGRKNRRAARNDRSSSDIDDEDFPDEDLDDYEEDYEDDYEDDDYEEDDYEDDEYEDDEYEDNEKKERKEKGRLKAKTADHQEEYEDDESSDEFSSRQARSKKKSITTDDSVSSDHDLYAEEETDYEYVEPGHVEDDLYDYEDFDESYEEDGETKTRRRRRRRKKPRKHTSSRSASALEEEEEDDDFFIDDEEDDDDDMDLASLMRNALAERAKQSAPEGPAILDEDQPKKKSQNSVSHQSSHRDDFEEDEFDEEEYEYEDETDAEGRAVTESDPRAEWEDIDADDDATTADEYDKEEFLDPATGRKKLRRRRRRKKKKKLRKIGKARHSDPSSLDSEEDLADDNEDDDDLREFRKRRRKKKAATGESAEAAAAARLREEEEDEDLIRAPKQKSRRKSQVEDDDEDSEIRNRESDFATEDSAREIDTENSDTASYTKTAVSDENAKPKQNPRNRKSSSSQDEEEEDREAWDSLLENKKSIPSVEWEDEELKASQEQQDTSEQGSLLTKNTKDPSYRIAELEPKELRLRKPTIEDNSLEAMLDPSRQEELSDWDVLSRAEQKAKALESFEWAIEKAIDSLSSEGKPVNTTTSATRSLVIFAAKSEYFHGYLALAAGKDNIVSTELSGPFRKRLLKALREHGLRMELYDPFYIVTNTMEYEELMKSSARITYMTAHMGEEVGISFLEVAPSLFEAKYTKADGKGMYKVSLDSIEANQPVAIDLFLHLKHNNKFIKYVPQGGIIDEEQLQRLRSKQVDSLCVEDEQIKKWRESNASQFFNKKIKKGS